jgi:hypothetical protein
MTRAYSGVIVRIMATRSENNVVTWYKTVKLHLDKLIPFYILLVVEDDDFCDRKNIGCNTFTDYGRQGLATWKSAVSCKQQLIFCVTYYLNLSSVCRLVSIQHVI